MTEEVRRENELALCEGLAARIQDAIALLLFDAGVKKTDTVRDAAEYAVEHLFRAPIAIFVESIVATAAGGEETTIAKPETIIWTP